MMQRTVSNIVAHYGCDQSTAQRYIDLRDEGYPQHQALLMAGLSDPDHSSEDDPKLASAATEPGYRFALMGDGKVAIGTCRGSEDGLPGIIYLDMGNNQRPIDSDTSDLFQPGTAADPSKILACVKFRTAEAVQQSIDVLREISADSFGVPISDAQPVEAQSGKLPARHPLSVFTNEVAMGAYPESQLRERAKKALEWARGAQA